MSSQLKSARATKRRAKPGQCKNWLGNARIGQQSLGDISTPLAKTNSQPADFCASLFRCSCASLVLLVHSLKNPWGRNVQRCSTRSQHPWPCVNWSPVRCSHRISYMSSLFVFRRFSKHFRIQSYGISLKGLRKQRATCDTCSSPPQAISGQHRSYIVHACSC